jgi:integrase
MPGRDRLYLRGRIWWTRVYDAHGQAQRVSTHCTDKAAAAIVARRLEREAANPHHAAQAQARLTDALDAVIALKEEEVGASKRRPATLTFYRSKAGHLVRLLDVPMRALTPAAVDAYVSQRRSEDARDTTIQKELVVLSQALQLAKRRGLWVGDLAAVMPPSLAGDYQPRDRWLRPWELRALLEQLTPDRAARVAFAVATSANWSETDAAQRGDVGATLVQVRGHKRVTRMRQVPVVMPWQRDLLAFTAKHAAGVEGALFLPWQNVNRDLRAACARATEATGHPVAPVSTNDLRRTFGMWGRLSGQPLEYLAPMMGHATTTMLQRVYGRLTADHLAVLATECDAGVPERLDTVDRMDSAAGGANEKPPVFPGVSGVLLGRMTGFEPATRGITILRMEGVSPRADAEKTHLMLCIVTPVCRDAG